MREVTLLITLQRQDLRPKFCALDNSFVILPRMKHLIKHTLATLLITLFIVSPAWATCGGGGGGGVRGMSSRGAKPVGYNLPLKGCAQNDPPAPRLIPFLISGSYDQIKRSSLPGFR